MSTREEIAAGPKWVRTDRQGASELWERGIGLCAACGMLEGLDHDTDLCRPCWRVWRFAARIHGFAPPVAVGANFELVAKP